MKQIVVGDPYANREVFAEGVDFVGVGAGDEGAAVAVEADEDPLPAVGAGVEAGTEADTVTVEPVDGGEGVE